MSDRDQKISEFKALDDISHVLTVPSRYIGSVNSAEIETYILKDDDKFHYEKISYTPGLLKIIEEVLDNSVDAYLNSSDRVPISIKVNMTKTSVEVIDTGCGIPVVKYQDKTGKLPELNGKWIPELAWGRLKAGGSFKEHRVGAGTHGEGSSLTNIFSIKFIGITDDGKKKCKVDCAENMHIVKATCLNSSGKSGTTVYFEPDLKRFNLKEITQPHFDLIRQRLINLSVSFPELKFWFNGERISLNAKNFIKKFSEHALMVKSENTLVGVFPSTNDEFQQYSYVNGLRIKDGGVHVDHISYQIVNPIREKLERKYKTLKPADIKNHLSLVIFLNDFENPQFNSQTKDELKNPVSDIIKHLDGKIDFERFAKDILKNDAIIEPIVETFKIKEELKARQELKKAKKVRIRSDKYDAPKDGTGMKYLALCEGASAQSGISASLGNDGIGYYAMRGLPLNAYDSTMQKIVANQELKDIINILSLDITKNDKASKTIDFEKILITTDADADGAHVSAMLIGWFKKFAPNLFNEGRICKLVTPLIIVEDQKGKILHYFFDVPAFKQWEVKNPNPNGKIRYLKGLGSWERSQLIELIDKNGLDKFIVEYHLDDEGDVYIDDWLGPDAEKRKKYLRVYDFDIDRV